MHFNTKDRTGERFGRLVLREYLGGRKWRCLCDCGNEKIADTSNLTKGHITSCGCYRRERAATLNPKLTVGEYQSTEYTAWWNMLQRCYNPNSHNYKWYGAKGVTVCERWKRFENFFVDMGTKPSPELTLERKNTFGNYEPSNCVWATQKDQQNNRRNTGANKLRKV